jgi:hypothetical protein
MGMRPWCLVLLTMAGVLVGCGGVQRSQAVYAKPGVTEAGLRADQQMCRQQAIGQAESTRVPTWGQTMNREVYDDCMRTLGYDVDAGTASPRW